MRGVETLVFVSSDGEAARMMVHHQNVARATADERVKHVVYLSGLDADLDSPFCYAFTNGHTERLLAASGRAVSVVRASIFTEFFAGFVRTARRTGELRVPAGDGRVSLVSRTDVERCLAALATGAPTGRRHDVTGPESLSLDAVARAVDVPVRYVDVPPNVHTAELAEAGEDAWWTYAYSSMFASIREHRWETVSAEVLRLTGREPLSVADVLTY